MKRPFMQAHPADPWWVPAIQGVWFPTHWETSATGTVIELEDINTFIARCWIDGEPVPNLRGVRIIQYPRSWWRWWLLRLAGIR